MRKKICEPSLDKEVDVTAVAKETLQEVTAPSRVLRTHAESYVARAQRGKESIASVYLGHSSRRIMLSARQLKKELGYNGAKDWLEIYYDDTNNAVLIGKSDGEPGIKPIEREKKLFIYRKLIVKDFIDTLQLDLTENSGVSAHSFQREKIDGKDFIVLTRKDFVY